MDWYYAKEGRRVGPIAEAEFRSLVAAGTIQSDTPVWNAGMPEWQPYRATQAGGQAAPATGETCSQCGRTVPRAEMIQYGGQTVCAACKPAFMQRLREGAAIPGVARYGGFWIRVAARIVDGLLLWVVNALVASPIILSVIGTNVAREAAARPAEILAMQAVVIPLQFAIAMLYDVLFVGRFGATPGKMVCRLKVVTSEMRRVSYGRSFGRYFGTILSSLTLGIGYLIAAFDDQKRSLHDRLCDTRVVRV